MEKTGLVLGTIIRRISGLGHCFNKIDWIAVGKIRELGNCYCVSCNRKIVVMEIAIEKFLDVEIAVVEISIGKFLLWKLQLGNCFCGNCNWEFVFVEIEIGKLLFWKLLLWKLQF